ncbi:MAG: filamentous hemagglutinin N-terminal domain-containing protein [Leptolyngbyaceae cyanobacterium SM2_5_2]|nr:filamentous hemagglutinin N-terminal domain-containing protein [Leptolyngbyaceae cyanobacterium SM2_5_2]
MALACQAQVWPDESLGPESSTLESEGRVNGLPALLIEGGAQRGQNLFHSFLEFNVDLQQRVYFANPAAVSNIFTRITGSHPSEIWGTLGVDGEADLYLLNPNGFLFGATATLDIAGSLMVSTGEDLPFADGFRYPATPTQTSDVLTMSVPLGLQTGLPIQGTIRNVAQIAFNPEQSLTFLGHRVEHFGSLASPGGTLQLLGDTVTVGETATLDVSAPNGGGEHPDWRGVSG